MMKVTTAEFGVIISISFFTANDCGTSWQACNDKCYFLGETKLDFDSQKGFCGSMSGVPVDLGVKMAQSIATFFLPCRLTKTDNEQYWINKRSVHCRTIAFDGHEVHMNQDENCTLLKYPICETKKSYCKKSNDSQELKHTWFRVDGTGPYFMFSRETYSYCNANTVCKNLNGQISPFLNFTFIGYIGTELGITGLRNVEFWLNSPGILCPTGQGTGMVMQFSGPMLHMVANKRAQLRFSVLCMTDNPSTKATQNVNTSLTSTKSPSTKTIQQARTPSTNIHSPSTIKTQQVRSPSMSTQSPSTTSTQQARTPSTSTQSPSTTSTQQARTPSTSTQSPSTTSTQQARTPSTSTQSPSTTSTQQARTPSTSIQSPSTTSTPQARTPSTSTQSPSTTSTQQARTPSTSTQAPSTTSTQQARTPSTSTQAPSTTSIQQARTPLSSTQSPSTTSTQQARTPSTSTQAPSTTSTQQARKPSTSTQFPSTTSTQQARTPSTSTQAPSTTSTQQARTPSTSTQSPSTKSKKQAQRPSTSTRSSTTNSTQQPKPLSTRSPNTESTRWIQIGQEEYYVNTMPLDYIKASKTCRDKMNASLVMFLDPLNYFSVLGKIHQITSQKKSFWVGAFGMEEGMFTDECMSYNNENLTLTTLSCHYEKFSVCRRLLKGNVSQILENPEFKTMIREMTVLRNETKRQMRKQTCATDRRPSSETAGGVGVFIICSVIVVMLMSDCSSIKSSFFNKKDKLR